MRINIRKSRPEEATEPTPDVTPEEQLGPTRIMGLIGVGMIVAMLLTIAYAIYQNSKTIAVDGTVVSYNSKTTTTGAGSSRTSNTSYTHRFSYIDNEGIERIGSTGSSTQDFHYSVGAVAAIGYYPDDPSLVRIHSWFSKWKIQLALLLFGSALIWYAKVALKQIRDKIAKQS